MTKVEYKKYCTLMQDFCFAEYIQAYKDIKHYSLIEKRREIIHNLDKVLEYNRKRNYILQNDQPSIARAKKILELKKECGEYDYV